MDDITRIIEMVNSLGQADGLSQLQPDEDIYDAGFSSINSLQLLVELETAYDVSIEDDDFIRSRTPRQLFSLVERLKEQSE
jgi:acyl carrier protein